MALQTVFQEAQGPNRFIQRSTKGPGTKHSRVFFWNEKMQEAKLKQQQEYMQQHTLTPQDLRRMIAEKLERARAHARNQQKVLSKNR